MTNPSTETTLAPEQPARRIRWGVILAWLGVLALLALVASGLFRTSQGPVAIGQPVPDFTLTTFDGKQISLADLKGKVVLINFWASWCIPCEQEAPDLEAAWRFYEPRGDVVFLGIDWTDTEPKALGFMAKFNITYPNGPDLGTRIADRYRITGVPETYIVDRNGLLAYKKFAPFTSVQEIKSAIDPLLAP